MAFIYLLSQHDGDIAFYTCADMVANVQACPDWLRSHILLVQVLFYACMGIKMKGHHAADYGCARCGSKHR